MIKKGNLCQDKNLKSKKPDQNIVMRVCSFEGINIQIDQTDFEKLKNSFMTKFKFWVTIITKKTYMIKIFKKILME